jgi:hypothetical protein
MLISCTTLRRYFASHPRLSCYAAREILAGFNGPPSLLAQVVCFIIARVRVAFPFPTLLPLLTSSAAVTAVTAAKVRFLFF